MCCRSLLIVIVGAASCGSDSVPSSRCTENAVRECSRENEHGRCLGQETCINGRWIGCTALTPAAEACNGFDDNCDGAPDEPFTTLGDACDGDDSDECENGTFTCTHDGSGVECTNESVRDIADICNGLDDDCNGTPDEDFPTLGEPCDGNDNDACENGTWTCNAWGSGVECINEVTEDIVEVCNGVDDDCDGVPDGAENLTRPCGVTDVGVCTLGIESCDDDGAWTCDAILPASEDLPDMAFVDSNCDGVDGDLTRAVFVSQKTGSDASTTCTFEEPCLTIMHALGVAATGRLDQVLVQTGAYREVVDLSAAHDGITIYGGYASDWSRGSSTEPDFATIIAGTWHSGDDHRMGVRARSTAVAFDNLEIRSPGAVSRLSNGDGTSSYAVHAVDSTLDFSRVVFRPGDGRNGLDGTGGSTPTPDPAPSGNTGGGGAWWVACTDGLPAGGTAPTCQCGSAGAGGTGGVWPCTNDADRWGGDGDDGNCSGSGDGATGGLPGLSPTADGANGANGGNGPAGRGGAGVRLEGGLWWTGIAGTDGTTGAAGCGGGGGGGGGVVWVGVGVVHGSGGGSGGCGGCGGGRGTAGRSGGGSVGIMALSSTISLESCAFFLGDGGDGGDGGNGAGGAGGGDGGGPGGVSAGGVVGSFGGDGGNGGAGGGGGGGGGGPSFAVVSLSGSVVTQRGVTVSGGAGGNGGGGGVSVGNDGAVGSPGLAGGTYFGDAAVGRFLSADTPTSIPDEDTAFSTIPVALDASCTYQAEVDVELDHESHGDLRIEVEAPNGSVFVLRDHVSGTGDLVITGEALTGQPLPQPATGAWVLRIHDTEASATGTLEAWALVLSCAP